MKDLIVNERDGEPFLFVASEAREAFGGACHSLGVFPGEGHLNLGDSDEWAARDKFEVRRDCDPARFECYAL